MVSYNEACELSMDLEAILWTDVVEFVLGFVSENEL